MCVQTGALEDHDTAAEAGEVRALIDGLGIPGIIDVHTHFMPDSVLRKVWHYFDRVGERAAPWPITYRHQEDVRLAALRGFGVQTFSSLVYPHKPEMAAWLNGWAAEFADRTLDCLRTATFYPEPSAAVCSGRAGRRGTDLQIAHPGRRLRSARPRAVRRGHLRSAHVMP